MTRKTPLARKTPLKRKVKKPSAKTLTAKLDALARAHCIANACGKCLRCGGRGRLEWCHLKSRGYKAIRWNPANSAALCCQCHRYFTMNPDLWREFMERLRPGIWGILNKILQRKEKPDYAGWLAFYKEQGA